MPRILQIGDLHLSEYSTLGGRLVLDPDGLNVALLDRINAVRSVIDAALMSGPLDGIVITGDVFDRPRPTPTEIRAAGRLLGLASRKCDAGRVLIVVGNHDEPRNTSEPTALASVELAPFLHVVERPEVIPYAGLQFACLPYPRRSAFRELATELDPSNARHHFEAALRALCASLLATMIDAGGPDQLRALVYHGTVGGAVVGVQPRTVEGDIELAVDMLDLFPAAMLGHIHKRQQIGQNGWYAGSPCIMDFGEADDCKGGVLWTFDGVRKPSAEPVAITGRKWYTMRLEGAAEDPTAVDRLIARLESVPVDGNVYRVQGKAAELDVRRLRAVIRERAIDGQIIKDELEVIRPNRMRDASIAEAASGRMTDDVVLKKALATRGINGDRAERLLALHAVVQQGGTR